MRSLEAGPLVQPDWLQERLGQSGLIVVEADELPELYRRSHIPGAVNIDVRSDLQAPVMRDLPSPRQIEDLWRRLGVTRDARVVFYGDSNNWYASFAFWVFRYFGLSNLSLLDGGRQRWLAECRPTTIEVPIDRSTADPPSARPDESLRAYTEDLGEPSLLLLDVRTAEEYLGEAMSEPAYPSEAAQRAGHIPGAVHLPWEDATRPDGRFRDIADIRRTFEAAGLESDSEVITYCRVGERSAHTWFVLHELLGVERARNYDGSWTEWGSTIGAPVAIGPEPGEPAPGPSLD